MHKLSETFFKKFKSVYPEIPHKSCRNRTIKLVQIKSVHFDVKRLSRDREIHIPRKIHVGVFHNDTTGDCKHHQKKVTASMDCRLFNMKGVPEQMN